MKTIQTLTQQISDRGVSFNESEALKLLMSLVEQQDILKTKLIEEISSNLDIAPKSVSLNSSALMVRYIYGYLGFKPVSFTKAKKTPSLAEEHLDVYANASTFISDYIKYRKESKRISFLSNLLNDSQDGVIHSKFNCTGAIHGRFTSSNPNLQQVPPDLRKLFVARKGFKLVTLDLKQAEFSVLAQLAKAPHLNNIHQKTSEEQHVSYEDAKTINLGILYGMTGFGVAKILRVSQVEGDRYLSDWHNNNKEMSSYIAKIQNRAIQENSISIFDNSLSVKDNFLDNPGRAVNIHVAGSAAKLLKTAMLNIDNYLAEACPAAGIILTNHDELVLEIPDTDKILFETVVEKCISLFTNISNFSFYANVSVASTWVK